MWYFDNIVIVWQHWYQAHHWNLIVRESREKCYNIYEQLQIHIYYNWKVDCYISTI